MMKKLHTLMAGMLTMLTTVATAQTVTLDFSVNNWGLPEGAANKGTEAAAFTNGTYTVQLAAPDNYYFNTQGYLMLGKKGATMTLPAFNFDVETIKVTGRTGASGNVLQNIYVGTEEVSTQTKGAAGENTYAIAEAYQKAGNVFVIQVNSAHNTQITKVEVFKKGEGPVGPVDPGKETVRIYKKASAIESGKAYVLVAQKDDELKIAKNIASNYKYGYLQVATVTDKQGEVQYADQTCEFTFETTDGGYTIKQADGRYLYQTGTYNSFNVTDQPTEGQVWTAEAQADGTFKITNASVQKYIQLDAQYGTYGSYNEEKGTLPVLYVFDRQEEAKEEIPEVSTLAALEKLGDGAKAVLKLTDAKVTYVSPDGQSVYVRDNTGGICFYKQSALAEAQNTWTLGGTLEGTVSIYRKALQFNITSAEALTHTVGAAYQAVTISQADAPQHFADLVTLSERAEIFVEESGTTTRYYTSDDKSLQIYDNFKLGYTLEEGDEIDGLTGVIIRYNDFWEIAPVSENLLNGIATVSTSAAASATVFNLQGQRLSAPAKGLNIVGGKKVMVK